MRTRVSLLCTLGLALAACPTGPPDGSDPAPLVFIEPAVPTTVDALTVTVEPPQDAGFSWENWAITWQRDGAQVIASDGALTVPATSTNRAEAWTVTLTSVETGETATSATTIVANSIPSLAFANIDPVEPRSDEVISVLAGGWIDADLDPEGYTYEWLVDGDSVGAPDSSALQPGWCVAGQQVSVIVTPTDGIDAGEPITATAVPIKNGVPLAPTVVIQPDEATDGDDLICVVTESFDPDGDATTIAISWTVGGVAYPALVPGAIGPSTTTIADDTVPTGDTSANQNWICTAVANDGSFDSDPGTASAYLAAGPVSDFGLEDVNATSPRVGQVVSPRDYLQKVSGWYFGHAT